MIEIKPKFHKFLASTYKVKQESSKFQIIHGSYDPVKASPPHDLWAFLLLIL